MEHSTEGSDSAETPIPATHETGDAATVKRIRQEIYPTKGMVRIQDKWATVY